MQLTIDQGALLKALGHVQSVVERRNTIPILSNVLLSASEDGLGLTATDLDMEVRETATAARSTDGSITVPAATLFDIVRKFPVGGEVAIAFNKDDPRASIRCGRSKFNLPILSPSDFPVMSADGLDSCFEVEASALATLIDRTRFCMSTEETRYYLNGLYIHTVADGGSTKLRAVSTDGHRLALAEMPAPAGSESAPGVIVPRKTINEVRKLLGGAEGPVTISLSQSKIRIEIGGGAVLTSKVIDGSFPDYVRVIPRDNTNIVKVDPDLLKAAVDRVATISAEKSRSTKLGVSNGLITLTVRNMEAGQGVEEVECEYDGAEFAVGFNARYLLDVCGQLKGDVMHMEVGDPTGPVRLVDPADPSALFVLMPLRV